MTNMHDIRIAIVGGGIARLTLLQALLQYSHLDANLYDAGSAVAGEGGANVGLNINASMALEKISPQLRSALDLAGAVPGVTQLRVGKGMRFGHSLKLLATVPGKRVHVRKRLRSTTEEGTTVTLTFEDDTDTTVDAVIRCDGIRSSIRKIVLGQDHPASEPVHAGTYNYIALLPMEEARRKIDCDRHKEGQVGWLGDGGFLMHDPSSNKETLQIVAAIVSDEAWNPEDWSKSVRAERVKNDLSSWGTLGESLTECFLAQPEIHVFPLQELRPAPTFGRDLFCVTGDAAHAMQPWQGAGAGQAIEDSLLLSSVMSLIDKTSRVPLHMQVRMAFAAFDTQRRPRAQRVASLSRGMSYIMTGRAPGIQLHKEKLEQALTGRWDYIWYVDLNSEVMEAKRLFEESMWLHY